MSMKRILARVAAVVIVGCASSLPSYAGDEAQDARVQKGKLWYDSYCTPCHGADGAPGTAVFAATKKPIDLRTYQQRNDGTFPDWKWWDVTFNPRPGAVHTEVWERIQKDQRQQKGGESDRSWEIERDITARGVVANIEYYVRSIQNEKK